VTSSTYDLAVAGGGAIGLACAWRAVGRGLRTIVLDAGDPGAWEVAAGMLAPVTEAQIGDAAAVELGLRAVRGFGDFCAELGEDVGHRTTGTLLVARDPDEAEALEREAAFRRELGLEVERLRPSQARRAEPALAPTVRLALDVPGDHSVDPRRMVAALRTAFERAGGEYRRGRVVAAFGGGVRLDNGEVIRAGQALVATGTGRIEAPDPVPVRPVKGQIMRLRDPRATRPHPPLIDRTIRGPQAYLVPRADGGYVLGATMEERGYDTVPTAGGVYELLRDMSEVVPGVLELDVQELRAGLRPGTPDNLPAIGPGTVDGLLWATGHFRNGILLAPLTAELIAAAACGEPLPEWAAQVDPRRFAGVGESAGGDSLASSLREHRGAAA
jgi:glycine oxidase